MTSKEFEILREDIASLKENIEASNKSLREDMEASNKSLREDVGRMQLDMHSNTYKLQRLELQASFQQSGQRHFLRPARRVAKGASIDGRELRLDENLPPSGWF